MNRYSYILVNMQNLVTANGGADFGVQSEAYLDF